jgi:hypothetical protein
VQYSGSNPVPITATSIPVTKSGTWAIDNPVAQGDAATALRVILAGNSDASVVVNSGTITTVTTLTGITNTVSVGIVDSGGDQYSGSNPLPVTLANTGSTQNVNFVGGGNDSVFTYQARTTNPTAVADGADVRPKADKLGRLLSRPIQVRELIATAYATVTTGIETTLATAAAGGFLDCIMLTATNASSAAVQVDIRAVSGGNIVHTMYIPATTGPVGWVPTVPWPQDATGNAWTFKNPGTDQSNTSIYVSALFSTEV